MFGPETTQEEFFEGAMKQPVQDFLDGYNRLVFTYGVTNAGKTYTFQGKSRNEFFLQVLPFFFIFFKVRITSSRNIEIFLHLNCSLYPFASLEY